MDQKIDLEVTPSLHARFAVGLDLVHVSFVLNGKSLPERFSFSFPEAERLGKQIEQSGMWIEFPVIALRIFIVSMAYQTGRAKQEAERTHRKLYASTAHVGN
jgi:hypothetical protein